MIARLAMHLPIDFMKKNGKIINEKNIAPALLAMKMTVVKKNANLSLAIILGIDSTKIIFIFFKVLLAITVILINA